MRPNRVLCVDDDAPILRTLRDFDWAGCHCQWVGEAANGRDALALAERLQPDIALVDVVMPVMDGLAFIQEAGQRLPGMRCVVISAYCDFEYARQALRYGATEYLTKGEYTDDDLRAVLARLAGGQPDNPAYRYEVQYAIDAIDTRIAQALSLEIIAREIGISPNYLGQLFTQATGKRFRDYLTARRMDRAKELLLHTPLRIYEVAQQVGIHNAQYFASVFHKHHGVTPGALRR